MMYEQYLYVQCNSSTSGYYATITKAEGLAMKQHIKAQRNTVGHKKGFQWDHLLFFTKWCRRSSTISHLQEGWFSHERRPEIKFLYQGLKRTVQPEDGMPISMQMLRHLGSSIMQGFPNVNSVEPPMAPQKQRRMVTSQMQLIITTNWQFLWKQNAVKYL
jgi:hypothetical protein